MTPRLKIGVTGTLSATALTGLLLTTALSAAFSSAEAGPVRVSLGGKFVQFINILDADDSDDKLKSAEDEVLAQDAEIYFTGKSMLDSGTEIGFRVELEASSDDDGNHDQIDEHYVYVKGNYGKLIMGAENGVGHLMQVRAPSFVPGLKMFDNSLTDEALEKAYDIALGTQNAIQDAHMSTKLEHISGDANKITYMTPRVGGLQVGVSLAPNNKNLHGRENNSADVLNVSDVTQDEILELAVKYSGKTAGIGYKFSYTSVEGNGVRDVEDAESTSVGVKLSYGKYVFGANMSEYENLGAVDSDNYNNSDSIETVNYALKYRLNDRHYFGIGFTDGEETEKAQSTTLTYVSDFGDDNQNGGDDDNADTTTTETRRSGKAKTSYKEMMIGGGIKLAKGVSLGYYYSQGEVTHQLITGTPAVVAPTGGADDTLGAGGDDVLGSITGEYMTENRDTEVETVGITLALKF